jgi:hypothetical protein
VRLGYVTDFIDLRWWPAFNLADSFIVIGVLVLLAALVYAEREPPRRKQHSPGDGRRPSPASRRATTASLSSLPAKRDAPPRPS